MCVRVHFVGKILGNRNHRRTYGIAWTRATSNEIGRASVWRAFTAVQCAIIHSAALDVYRLNLLAAWIGIESASLNDCAVHFFVGHSGILSLLVAARARTHANYILRIGKCFEPIRIG